jgi:hypothetical protein
LPHVAAQETLAGMSPHGGPSIRSGPAGRTGWMSPHFGTIVRRAACPP